MFIIVPLLSESGYQTFLSYQKVFLYLFAVLLSPHLQSLATPDVLPSVRVVLHFLDCFVNGIIKYIVFFFVEFLKKSFLTHI